MKNKKNLILVLGIILLGVGGTLAYFTSTGVFNNIFNTGTYSTRFHEEFTSPSNWMPGDETPKTITVTNDGDIPAHVRVCLTDSWLAADGTTELPNHDDTNNIDIAIVNADNTDEWTKSGNCYYYNEELAPNETTSSPIKSVTFNPSYEGSVECTTEQATGDLVCTSTDTGYDGATYTLTLTGETIQSEGLGEWGIGYSIDGTNYSLPDSGRAQTTSGYNTFLRSNLTSTGTSKEVGFVYNNTTYYVGESNSYEENKDILDEAFGVSNCSAVSGSGGHSALYSGFTGYHCSCEEFDVDLDTTGNISITHYKTNGNFTCDLYVDDYEACYEFKGGYSATGSDRYETAIEAMEAEGHLNYLRYQVNGKNVTSSVGFKLNNQEYYLIGGDEGASYSTNKTTLESAFGSSNCTDNNGSYECTNETFEAGAYNDGYVSAQERASDWGCYVSAFGDSECLEGIA